MAVKTKGMILAAGFGTRLGNITKDTPKCLVDINGKPILQLVIEKFIAAGVASLVINVHYLAEKIENFLNLNDNFGIDIYVSHEDVILGTGGGVKHAWEFLKDADRIIVHNSDIYSDLPLESLMEFHEKNKALVSLAVMHRDTERPLLFARSGHSQSGVLNLCGWENTSKGIGEVFGNEGSPLMLAFSGIQVISREMFKYYQDETGEFSSIRVYLKAARNNELIIGYLMDNNYWIDIGTPEKLAELRNMLIPKGSEVNN